MPPLLHPIAASLSNPIYSPLTLPPFTHGGARWLAQSDALRRGRKPADSPQATASLAPEAYGLGVQVPLFCHPLLEPSESTTAR